MNSFVVILLWVLRRWDFWDDSPACWWRALFWPTTRWNRRFRCKYHWWPSGSWHSSCTALEWYSSHWTRRSSAGRTRKLLRGSYSWDEAENPHETLKIPCRYEIRIQTTKFTANHQHTGYLNECLSGRVPLPWQPINKQASRKSRRHAKTGSTQKLHKPISRKSRQHAKHVRNFVTRAELRIITHSVAWPLEWTAAAESSFQDCRR